MLDLGQQHVLQEVGITLRNGSEQWWWKLLDQLAQVIVVVGCVALLHRTQANHQGMG